MGSAAQNADVAIQAQQAQVTSVAEKKSAVWEEALIQEFIYAIAHLNHVEQHLMEEDAFVGEPIFGDLIDLFREQRKFVGQVLFNILNIEAQRSGTGLRSAWESIWCALKHVTTALIHVDECIEKLLRKARESQDPAMIDNIRTLLRVRKTILEGVLAIIDRSRKASTALTEASARCREDICLEAEQK